jgi:hypothetical protein
MSHLEDLARSERANRGKYAEGKVREYLKVVGLGNKDFDWERKYDARASRGRIPSQTGDFGFYSMGQFGVIEAKEVHHDFRLPKKNFDPEKWGRLQLRRWAGGSVIILVCHMTTKLWRMPDFDFFLARRDQPSWDLSEFPTFKKVSDALVYPFA